nr:hypothetical protein [Schwartzia sp. (in: firmicutes)]
MDNNTNMSENGTRILSPKQLKEELDKFVTGQEEAKKVLCVAMYRHLARSCKFRSQSHTCTGK